MITSCEELQQKLNDLYLGITTLKVEVTSFNSLSLPAPFPQETLDSLRNSSYWIDNIIQGIGVQHSRCWNETEKKWALTSSAINSIKERILYSALEAIKNCSDAKNPERTQLYRDYKAFNKNNLHNSAYITDLIQILNYYHTVSTTDSNRNKNTIGLFTILRKRYGASN